MIHFYFGANPSPYFDSETSIFLELREYAKKFKPVIWMTAGVNLTLELLAYIWNVRLPVF